MYKTVLQRFAEQYDKPVYYLPFFGHGKYNQPFILGETVTLQRNIESVELDASEYITLRQTPLNNADH
jgi:muramoyltetrapeptide carboxypeptidase